MKVGIIGLGKMGSRIATKLQNDGHEVVAWNRTKTQNPEFKLQNSIQELIQNLEKPRVVWIMVPNGAPTNEVLSEVSKYIEKDDIVIDGGNAFYKDTEKRYRDFQKKGIKFLGIGVSGGLKAFENGYPLMVGGEKSAYEFIKPILDSLSKPSGGHDYFGEGGAGHFVKMVHNGIEYGMMQSIGEGFGVLEKSKYDLDLLKVAKIWQKGTIVSGFLMDRTKEVFEKGLEGVVGIVNATGEAQWTVEAAKEEGVEVEIIEESLEFRKKSQTDPKIQSSFAAKVVAGLRNAFGGHEVKKK